MLEYEGVRKLWRTTKLEQHHVLLQPVEIAFLRKHTPNGVALAVGKPPLERGLKEEDGAASMALRSRCTA